MSDTIILDYESVIAAADKFDQLSVEILDEARSMTTFREGLSDAWKGESGDIVQQICTEWGAVHKKLGDSVAAVASKMRTAAEMIKAADEQAAANNSGRVY